jgi:hypothetical protein
MVSTIQFPLVFVGHRMVSMRQHIRNTSSKHHLFLLSSVNLHGERADEGVTIFEKR